MGRSQTGARRPGRGRHTCDVALERKDMKQPVTQSDSYAAGGFGWGDPNWRKTSWSRCFIIPEIMRSGYHLIWSDIDVVWFRNPTEMLPLHPEVSDSRACKLGSWDSCWSIDVQLRRALADCCHTTGLSHRQTALLSQAFPSELTMHAWGCARRTRQRTATISRHCLVHSLIPGDVRCFSQVDMVMGSDHIATSLAKGDAYFERPAFAFDHQFNAGASLQLTFIQRRSGDDDAISERLEMIGVTRSMCDLFERQASPSCATRDA